MGITGVTEFAAYVIILTALLVSLVPDPVNRGDRQFSHSRIPYSKSMERLALTLESPQLRYPSSWHHLSPQYRCASLVQEW
jgi:hypothetical protein